MDFDILFGFAALLLCSLVLLDLWALTNFILRKLGKKKPKLIKFKLDLNTSASKRKANWQVKLNHFINFAWKYKLLFMHVLFICVSFYVLRLATSPIPAIASSYPTTDENWNDYSTPITIVFNEPILISRLKPTVSVESLQGKWVYERYLGFLPLTRVAKFYPSNTLLPNQRIVVYMAGMARLGVDEGNEGALNFFSQKEPEVKFTIPENDSVDIAATSEITYRLTADNHPYDKWEFEITPPVDFSVETPDASTFVIHPTKALAQSQTYSINTYRTAIIYNTADLKEISHDNRLLVHQLKFSTLKAPLVKQFTPTGTGVRENTTIQMIFDLPMQRDSVESSWQITPPIDGTFDWQDDSSLVFTPKQSLPKETAYTVKLPAGVKSKNGGVSETDITYSFTTIGAVRVNSFYPANGSVRANRMTQIRVNFDQEVDQNSAMSHFGISPTATGNITFDGNNLVFTPTAALAFNTTYTISLTPGIKSSFGLDSRDNFTASFTTVSNQTLIAGFNLDLQDYDFTCGVAAAKMMLAWKGINASEDSLVGIMGEDTSPWQWNGSTHTWGDPNRSFLGYKGRRTNGGGGQGSGWIPGPGQSNNEPAYGALWSPIIKAYQAYGIQTELKRNWNLAGLASAIAAGHPVQIWWYNGVSYGPNGQLGEYMTWQDNVTGQTITALEGMHSIDVIGFNGDVDNPTSFIVMDPWWGYQTYSASKFNWQWPYLSNTGLIIY